MKKRLLALLLILSLTGTLFAGCGTNSEQPNTNEKSVVEPTPESSEIPDSAEEPNIPVEPTISNDTTVEEAPAITEQPSPTEAIVPTEIPEPTETVTPTETAKSTTAPTPTETPTSTKSPEPTTVPKPTSTPAPTTAPKPTSTLVPTATPKPTKAPVHRHEYNDEPVVITAPTCSATGSGMQTCSCGETRIVELRKTPCNNEKTVKFATCAEEGKSTSYCTICGTINNERILPKQPHNESDWEVITEATCTKEGLRHKTCLTCNAEITTEVIPCWENHPFEWHTDGDTRTNICSECGFVGITEYRYGNVWGYYDDAEAADLWYWINEQRKTAIQGLVDDWGHPAGIKNVDPLIADSSLTELARTRCTEIATDFSHGSYLHENLAWGYPTGRDVYVAWCYSMSHARAMINPEYIYGGTAFFWYDGNDSGINLTPLAVLTFSY